MSYTPPTKTISLNQYEIINSSIQNIGGLINGPNNSLYYTVYADPNVYNLDTGSSYIDISNYMTYPSYNLTGIVFDNLNNLYITDKQNSVVYKVDSTKTVKTLPIGGLYNPSCLCMNDNYNTLYIVNNGQDNYGFYNIIAYNLLNNLTTTVFSAIFTLYNLTSTSSILFNNGYLYFIGKTNIDNLYTSVLFQINLNNSSFKQMNDLGTSYNFLNPLKMTFDNNNNLYISNTELNNPYSLIGKFVPTYTSGVITAFTFYEAYTTQISSNNSSNQYITYPYTLLYYNNRLYCGNGGTNSPNLIAIYNEFIYQINNGGIFSPGASVQITRNSSFPIFCSMYNLNSFYVTTSSTKGYSLLGGYKLSVYNSSNYNNFKDTYDNTNNKYIGYYTTSNNNYSVRLYYKSGEIIQTGISCDSLPY